MKRKISVIVITAAVLIIGAIVSLSLMNKKPVYTFDTVKVSRGTISNTVTATGTIEAITTVEVGTQVSGIIEHVYVDFNDNVKQGQVLAKLDETSLRAQVEQSQATVDQAQAQLNFQEATFNRLKALFEKNLIAQADYDQALFNFENSRASLSNARSALARARVNLAYATIYSPIDGVVLNRAIEEGQTVAASFNTPEMFTIVNDLTQMEVQTSVDEADIGRIKQGQRVEFTVDAYPDLKFEGSVSQVRLQPVTTNNVVTYVVILNAPNPEKKLMPGMTASATIFIEEKHNTLVVSGKSLRFTPDEDFLSEIIAQNHKMERKSDSYELPTAGTPEGIQNPVDPTGHPVNTFPLESGNRASGVKMLWIKSEKDVIHPVPVTIGIENGSNVEIIEGLKEGDEVVIAMSGNKKIATTENRNSGPRGPFPF
ncbi:MAG: efflux RND transporter periplasmic adaptor subunit [Bacteroidales bacterium]|nr:efflux RND transporter periplasmic adaptor subunit [Bacteroidales bacterium]